MAVSATKRSVMTFFSDPLDMQSHRVRVVLAEKNVTCDIVDVDPLDLPEDVIDLNPYASAPTLVDRDLVLFDARIIMEYLDERFPHPPLLPVDPVSRATARQFTYRVERDWFSLADQIIQGGKGAAKARKELKESLISTSPIFAAKPFFMSDEFSLVDASIGPLLWRLPSMGIDLTGAAAKAVSNYAANLFKRQAFLVSLTELEREMRQ